MQPRNRKRMVLTALFVLQSGCASLAHHPVENRNETSHDVPAVVRFAKQSVDDHRRHYRGDVMVDLLPPLVLAGTLANTNADQWIRDSWQQDVRNNDTDNLARVFLHAGDAAQNRVSVPLYTITMFASGYSGFEDRDSPIATWAARSLRANMLGGPQAWVLTYALGSHRPTAGNSDWNPWNDNDGVSGHSFYGAVPFLTAARMIKHPGLRYTLVAVSALPAWARINENKHYTSQAVMGWSIAWLATRTVASTETSENEMTILPVITPDGGYVQLYWSF